jgi:hypothetical protein
MDLMSLASIKNLSFLVLIILLGLNARSQLLATLASQGDAEGVDLPGTTQKFDLLFDLRRSRP